MKWKNRFKFYAYRQQTECVRAAYEQRKKHIFLYVKNLLSHEISLFVFVCGAWVFVHGHIQTASITQLKLALALQMANNCPLSHTSWFSGGGWVLCMAWHTASLPRKSARQLE